MDLGGVLCKPRRGSELEYQECRVLGIWIKALNYMARGSKGVHRLGWEHPIGLKTVGPTVTPHPICGAELKESQS